MRKYRLISKKGEGTFAEVIKAQNIKTGTLHAIKCMKTCYKSADQVSSLREIQAIKRLSPHPNVVKLEEVLFDPPSGRLALVFELMEANLYELMKDRSENELFSKDAVKSFMRQIFTALDHMHGKGVFHRDIKPENILVDKSGRRLKLADFGSCRGINGTPPFTEYISTRWYRPPECLLTCGMYGPEMDVWGAGCILFELTTLYPLFPGTNESDQISRIHRVLGTPKKAVIAKLKLHASTHVNFHFPQQEGLGLKKLLPDAESNCLDLLTQTLHYDKSDRITSKKAMKHSYFVGDIQSGISSSKPSIGSKGKGRGKQLRKNHHVHPSPTQSSTLPPVLATKHAPKTVARTERVHPDVDENDEPPVPKARSMVSILLARSNKKDFIQDSKDRNKTFYHKGKSNKPSGKKKEARQASTNLPKIVPPPLPAPNNTSKSSSFKKYTRRQPKQYKNIQSSGYGVSVSTTKQTQAPEALPSLAKTGNRGFETTTKKTKPQKHQPLPVQSSSGKLGRGFR